MTRLRLGGGRGKIPNRLTAATVNDRDPRFGGVFMLPEDKKPATRGGWAAGLISSSYHGRGGSVASLASVMPWEEGDLADPIKYRRQCHAAIVRGYYRPTRRRVPSPASAGYRVARNFIATSGGND